MIGSTISHYQILEKFRQKYSSPTSVWRGGQVGEGGMSEDCLRALFASSCNLQDPAERSESGRRAL